MADLLRKGLAAATHAEADVMAPSVTKDKQTGLPLIHCEQAASPQEELTPDRVANILLAQEMDWHHGAAHSYFGNDSHQTG